MRTAPPILERSTRRSWRDQTSAWGPTHTVGDSFEMDRVGIADGPLQTRAGRRAYLLIYGFGTVSLVAAALISGDEFPPYAWWAVAATFVVLGLRARQWRRAKLP